jgi:hypothetical protein
MIWTKSDLLGSSKVEKMLDTWMDQIERFLKENIGGLFIDIQELEMLCSLRGEIISLLYETEEEVTPFETRLCAILVKEIAAQMTHLMTNRVKKLHELETSAKSLIADFKGIHC